MAIFTVACAPLLACGSALPEPSTAAQPEAAFEEVLYAPPPARVERVPDIPAPGAIWIDGEWRWDGSRWAWDSGKWVAMPRGARFAPWAARRREDGVLLVAPGTFRDEMGKEITAPRPLALGRARDDAVIDAEGNEENTAPNVPQDEGVPRAKAR